MIASDEHLEAARLIRRAQTDFPWFCKTYIKIQTKRDGIQPFILRPYQVRLWKLIEKVENDNLPVRILLLKSRQLGFSTLMQVYMFWKTIFSAHTGCLTVAHDDETSKELFGKIEFAYENMPPGLHKALSKAKTSEKRGKKLSFGPPLNSAFHVRTSGAKNLGRGFTFRNVHLSEYAFWDKAENKLYALLQAIGRHPGTTCIIETTANGHNHFHKLWKRAVDGDSQWEAFFVGWSEDPDCSMKHPHGMRLTKSESIIRKRFNLTLDQIYWRRCIIEDEFDGDEELFRQEYPLTPEEAFMVSGNPYFGVEILNRLEQSIQDPIAWGRIDFVDGSPSLIGDCKSQYDPGPSFTRDGSPKEKSWWWIWEKPKEGTPYVIGADIAGGTSKDFSAAHIIDMQSNKIVATFRGKLDPDEFAYQLKWMGLTYNTAMIAPEKNGEGRATLLKLQKDLAYPRIFYHTVQEDWTGGVKTSWGWTTTIRTRPTILSELAAALRKRAIHIRCQRTWNDLSSFIRVDGKRLAQAASNANDDMVMSLAIANSSELRFLGSVFVDLSGYNGLEQP